MEKAILRILKLKVLDGGGLAMRGHTDQMMPAEYLMEHDSVRKASEPQAENKAGPNQWMLERCSHGAGALRALAVVGG